MLRRTVVGICTVLSLVVLEREARAQTSAPPSPSPCAAVREHVQDTVILFQPPSTFTICRHGRVQDGVVTDRSVYLELAPNVGPRMFDFRIRGKASDWTPVGLSAWETLASQISARLRDLDHSGEPLAEVPISADAPPPSQTPLRPLASARSRYLADVTPRYVDALHSVRSEVRELPVAAGVVRRWCAALATDADGPMATDPELRRTCEAPEIHEGAVEAVLATFDTAAERESGERRRAREAALAAVAHPEDGKVVADAVRALDEARQAASAVVAAGHTLRQSSAVLARAMGTLRSSLRSVNAMRPGVPVYLSTYSTAGNAELEVEASPSDIAAVGADPTHATTGKATATFPIRGRHYLDIEAGIGWAAGLTGSPYVSEVQNQKILQTQPVTEIVGLALVELEPLRFLYPERPVAGLLRLPVVGIPFTRDPTSNFFVGAGLGWTGVGSITAGPYILRETTLRNGFAANQTLPNGVPFSSVTVPGVNVGYFVSASVDLVGLFRLFVPARAPVIDALTGKEK